VARELDPADRELDLPFPLAVGTDTDVPALRLEITRAQRPIARDLTPSQTVETIKSASESRSHSIATWPSTRWCAYWSADQPQAELTA